MAIDNLTYSVDSLRYCVQSVGDSKSTACMGVKSPEQADAAKYCDKSVGSRNAVACSGQVVN